ncbi:hypothetical protein B9Z55_007677 [Caenorhabditis nigoni]|uniref:Tc3 transposase DNA binding domain-containing protein n=1 Tax=Caenorhabditis nigoni TaxID=1611254 RepID=A0A2G5VAV2_9PELO|nr:hypothetical protein B9Z55_007677 [Caenorhabditis nigoni]
MKAENSLNLSPILSFFFPIACGTFLSVAEKAQIDLLRQLGYSILGMSKLIERSRNVIRRYLDDPLNYGSKSRHGRPRKMKPRDDRSVVRAVGNTMKSANDLIRSLNLQVSKSTVLRSVKRSGVIVRQKMKKAPCLTDAHKKARLEFVKNNLATDWKKVLLHFIVPVEKPCLFQIVFSDEKKFNLDGPDGNCFYWRDLRQDPRIFSRRNFGGGSVMLWGAFCHNKKLELKFTSSRMDSSEYQNVLQSSLVPFFRNRRQSHLFQQDNASVHRSVSTSAWLASKRIKTLDLQI